MQILIFALALYATIGTISVNMAVALFGGQAKPSLVKGLGVALVAALVGVVGGAMLGGFGVIAYAIGVVGAVAVFYGVGLARAAVIAAATVPCAAAATVVAQWLIG